GTSLAWKVSGQSEGPATPPAQASHSLPVDSSEPASSLRCPNVTEVKRPVAGSGCCGPFAFDEGDDERFCLAGVRLRGRGGGSPTMAAGRGHAPRHGQR